MNCLLSWNWYFLEHIEIKKHNTQQTTFCQRVVKKAQKQLQQNIKELPKNM